MKTDLKITMRRANGETATKTIPYLNPNATDAQIYGLAIKLVGLTTATFVQAVKIVTTEVTSNG